jgi:hypothetical protein
MHEDESAGAVLLQHIVSCAGGQEADAAGGGTGEPPVTSRRAAEAAAAAAAAAAGGAAGDVGAAGKLGAAAVGPGGGGSGVAGVRGAPVHHPPMRNKSRLWSAMSFGDMDSLQVRDARGLLSASRCCGLHVMDMVVHGWHVPTNRPTDCVCVLLVISSERARCIPSGGGDCVPSH